MLEKLLMLVGKKKNFWLFKTEPSTYSFQNLLKNGKTNWNGIRNYQARNYLKKTQLEDSVFIYHTGKEKAVVGTAEIISKPYADFDSEHVGDWFQVDVKPISFFSKSVHLSEMRKISELRNLLLLKQSRLSVMPISLLDAQLIIRLGGESVDEG